MSVDDAALDVWQVCVMLQRPHVQLSLLTQLGNARPVIVGECAIGQNGICHLWVGDQVDLQKLQIRDKGKSEICAQMQSCTHCDETLTVDSSYNCMCGQM